MHVTLHVVVMVGSEYVLAEGPAFPSGPLLPGESVGGAARRILREALGLDGPKLELLDMRARDGGLELLLRALVPALPTGPHRTASRMALPEKLGTLTGPYVEDALKTSLSYKLTRT